MKKKFLGLAIIAMSMMSFTSMAQTPQTTACPVNEQCTPAKGDCPQSACPANPCGKSDPFAGMNLTDSQKAQLKALKAKHATARAEQAKTRKTDRMRNDSLRVASRREARKQYLEEVKAIIGPDQYVTYLENIVIDTPQGRPAGHKDFAKGSRHGKKAGKMDKHRHHASARNQATESKMVAK